MPYKVTKILLLILFFNTISINIYSQNKNIAVIGKIIDSDTRKPISFVHIINFTSNRGTISDSLGIFSMKLDTGINSIKISSIGYYTKTMNINFKNIEIPFVIELKERIYEIMQVEIYPFTIKEFRFQFVHKDIPKDTIALIEDVMKTRWNSLEALRNLTPKRQIPLNFKTKVEKQEILLAKIKEYSALKTANLERIKKTTKLEGKDLYDFDRFCKFSFNFLKNAPEYYIYVKIEEKFEEYKNITPTNEDKFHKQ